MKYVAMLLVLLVGMLVLGTGMAQAANIAGTIASTLTISDNSKLTGDVTCTMTAAPCIKFGAPNIALNLHGFAMTGNGNRDSCTQTFGEDGIDTNAQNRVSIEGPGLVRRFNGIGIVVSGEHSEVERVTVLSNCVEGIRLLGSHNSVHENTVVRSSLGGNFFTGIFVSGSGRHQVQRNEVVGAGPLLSGGGHGIFVGSLGSVVATINNLIEENNVSGNPGAGIFVASASTLGYSFNSTGNVIRRNIVFGNLIYDDIFDDNPAGSNKYKGNACEVSNGPGAAGVCPSANIAGHQNPDDEE